MLTSTANKAIGIPSHDVIYQQCLDGRYNPLVAGPAGSHSGAELAAANPYCALIHRQYAGGPPLTPGNYGADGRFDARYINQGGIHTEGYDLQLDWGIGNFTVNTLATYLDTFQESPFPGADFFEFAGHRDFEYRLFTTVRYDNGKFSVGLRWQHLPERTPSSLFPANTLPFDSHDQFDAFGAWRPTARITVRAGIDNLTNADPVVILASTTNNNLGNTSPDYDQVGRAYFVGINIAL